MKIVIEGAASRLIPEPGETINPLHRLYTKARDAGLVAGICEACA